MQAVITVIWRVEEMEKFEIEIDPAPVVGILELTGFR